MIYDSAADLIGKTPLMHSKRFCADAGTDADIIVKLESRNPGGSANRQPVKH